MGISFFLGVFSSLVAAYFLTLIQVIRIRWGMRSLEGFWLEEVDGQDVNGDPYRIFITKVSFNRINREYTYAGRSFRSDGTPEWEWSTQALTIDRKENIIYYVYRSWRPKGPENEHYGFGLIRYARKEKTGKLVLLNGLFRGALEEHMPHSRTFYRAADIVKDLGLKKGDLSDISYQKYIVEAFRLSKIEN